MKKNLLNAVDIVVIITALLLLFVFGSGYLLQKKKQNGNKVLLTISVTSDKESILPLAKIQKQVYFNSLNTPVDVISVNNTNGLSITLSASGSVSDSAYIFNGQRVLVGQKAEIHSTYFAQGIITEVKNAN